MLRDGVNGGLAAAYEYTSWATKKRSGEKETIIPLRASQPALIVMKR
jgi:hypothetical protein